MSRHDVSSAGHSQPCPFLLCSENASETAWRGLWLSHVSERSVFLSFRFSVSHYVLLNHVNFILVDERHKKFHSKQKINKKIRNLHLFVVYVVCTEKINSCKRINPKSRVELTELFTKVLFVRLFFKLYRKDVIIQNGLSIYSPRLVIRPQRFLGAKSYKYHLLF